jgi:hypothetical protein
MGRNPRTVQSKLKASSIKETLVQATLKAVQEKETSIQTKLKASGEIDTAWSVVARTTKREQPSPDISNKKLDTKKTPPRPDSPKVLNEKATAATKSSINSSSPDKNENVLDEKDFPLLPSFPLVPLLSPPKKTDKNSSGSLLKDSSLNDNHKPPFI